MIEKVYIKKGRQLVARVKFVMPASTWATTINLVGDFNDWDQSATPFRCERDGEWSVTVDLPSGRAYQFRYLLDGREWISDGRADAFIYNQYGSDNGVLITDPNFQRYAG